MYKKAWNASIKQLLKFVTVGLITNFLGYCFFLVFIFLGIEHKFAMSLLYFISTLISFYGMKKWVFKNNQNIYYVFIKFFSVYFTGYFINLCLMIEFVDKLGYPPWFVQGAIIFIMSIYYFAASKWFVFVSKKFPQVI